MTKIANGVVEEVSNMEAYAMQNKTLSGYKPKVPQVSFGTQGKSAAEMSDEELLQALKNRNNK
jgi:hypothetical protein